MGSTHLFFFNENDRNLKALYAPVSAEADSFHLYDPYSGFIGHEGGRPNGIAFVELPNSQEATAAMAKNKQMMGSRYVEIFPANRSDLERYRARS